MLSGIQHFRYCPRQWALIHIDKVWDDNRLTAEGSLMHHNVDNPFYRHKRGRIIRLQSVAVASAQLGLYGVTDLVELRPTTSSFFLNHPLYPGRWQPYPIEYKHGLPKENDADELQLCAQAICLEEMYDVPIKEGVIFYGKTKHRHTVKFTSILRDNVEAYSERMHAFFNSGKIPAVEKSRKCQNCSLKDLCNPSWSKQHGKVKEYIRQNLYEEIT